jgi:hypothetical protein
LPKPLSPPDYPDRPESPLSSFGLSFAEEISRSVIAAVSIHDLDHPEYGKARAASSLTMLEAFEPADHMQCLIAAEGTIFHCGAVDNMARANEPGLDVNAMLRLQAMAVRLRAAHSACLRDVRALQGRPIGQSGRARAMPPPDALPVGAPPGAAPPGAEPGAEPPPPAAPDERQLVLDLRVPLRASDFEAEQKTRPDGTPGSLEAYLPKPFPPVIPKEAAINLALATRPKPWRQVNVPKPLAPGQMPPFHSVLTAPPPQDARGPLDIREASFGGDRLARFASRRVDPEAAAPDLAADLGEDEAIFEIELLNTGGTAEGEAHRAALIAAHPEGKPIRVIRYGPRAPAGIPPEPDDKKPPDTG